MNLRLEVPKSKDVADVGCMLAFTITLLLDTPRIFMLLLLPRYMAWVDGVVVFSMIDPFGIALIDVTVAGDGICLFIDGLFI